MSNVRKILIPLDRSSLIALASGRNEKCIIEMIDLRIEIIVQKDPPEFRRNKETSAKGAQVVYDLLRSNIPINMELKEYDYPAADNILNPLGDKDAKGSKSD